MGWGARWPPTRSGTPASPCPRTPPAARDSVPHDPTCPPAPGSRAAMSVAARSIGEAFVAIAGRDRVRDDADALAAAAIDGREPRWIGRPASIEQLSRVLAL